MLYFCADDYGMSAEGNDRIEECLQKGALNKVSVLPNGRIPDFFQRLSGDAALLALHLNLIEGRPLSDPGDVKLLVTEDGHFKYSFIGLFLLSLSPKRKALEQQLYREIQCQIRFWKQSVGESVPVAVDSHQHTHMIPLIFKTLLRVIREEGLQVDYLRIPAEPLTPYLLTPSLYLSYRPAGLVKQWLLKAMALVSRREWKKANIPSGYFLGVLFSGHLTKGCIQKLLPHYARLAQKHHCHIELGFHPGYMAGNDDRIPGSRADFGKFYHSPWRKVEYDTLMNFK